MTSLFARLGRRGLSLALLGVAWVVQGAALVLTRNDPARLHHSQIPHESIPWPLLGSMWIGFGLVAVIVGFKRSGNDTLGFLAASTMPMLYTVSYSVSFLTYVVTLGDHGWSLGILGFTIWGAVVALLGVLASWPEPTDKKT